MDATDAATACSGKDIEPTDEPLDLADLDLSRLRLSKKDLETLSSITPGLPKCFQEQLLAKLPPTQARKLSRTLSMQNSPQVAATAAKVYKRSQSGGRGLAPDQSPNALREQSECTTSPEAVPQRTKCETTKTNDEPTAERSSLIYRRSMSRTRYDYDLVPSESPTSTTTTTTTKSRSNSVCRDEYAKSFCSSYASDVSDKYKYYSPYLSKSTRDTSTTTDSAGGSVSPQKRYGSVSPRESSHNAAALGRPPSGCLSPPPPTAISADGGSSSLRRRSSQRRISRFLRPDFYEEPLETAENPYQREKKQRERDTQSVLREIREKSRESSRERLCQTNYDCDELYRRKQSLPNEEAVDKTCHQHVRNKSLDMYSDHQSSQSNCSQEQTTQQRRSMSRPRELSTEMDKSLLADKILEELQILSAVKSQHEQRLSMPREVSVEKIVQPAQSKEQQTPTDDDNAEKSATIKRVKKLKPKTEQPVESPNADTALSKTPLPTIKKVKKVIKKSDGIKVLSAQTLPAADSSTAKSPSTESDNAPKAESRLKRPKSYPTKEPTTKIESAASTKSSKSSTESNDATEHSKIVPVASAVPLEPRENRLVRPKSYPASKLTAPKEAKKITRSGIALPSSTEVSNTSTPKSSSVSRQSTSEEKSAMVTPSGKSSIDNSSSGESRSTSIKKIIKVTKKSKLVQPSAAVTPGTPGEDSKETSPKEKSPEKKIGKGLLYAIGQKFEKLRDSALSKDKKSTSSAVALISSSSSSGTTNNTTKKSASEKASPEKSKLLKKKKSLDTSSTSKTDKTTAPNIDESTNKSVKTPVNAKSTVNNENGGEQRVKSDKRSRIDAMIRSLRERSVPRSAAPPLTESSYIKRAVSVEEMPGTFNKNAVNKVLGLFKRFEKDDSERRVRSTRSTSNIERQMHASPASPIYQNAVRERPRSSGFIAPIAIKPKPTSNVTISKQSETTRTPSCECKELQASKFANCPECHLQYQAVPLTTKRHEETKSQEQTRQPTPEQTQNNKEKRKALMLDLVKMEKLDNNGSVCSRTKTYMNGNGGLYSNLPPYPGAKASAVSSALDNTTNNNNMCTSNNNNNQSTLQAATHYRTNSGHEINRNHILNPSTENICNYSSDSRSYQDDCASTSTFLSPTDEPELYFDNWSVCSEDNYMLNTPSPTVSRLSRNSQISSPTRGDGSDPNESVIDRIKRRSFYCRFNEKKPKRTSSIVGPTAVRDYYREQQAAVKARSVNNNHHKTSNVSSNASGGAATANAEREPSPDITQQFFRPLKLSPVGTELKPPIYKSPLDYTSAAGRPRKSLNDIRPPLSPSFVSKRYGASSNDNDYLGLTSAVPTRIKTSSGSSSYDSNGGGGGGYYNTYNPKRRSSYNLNGVLPSGSSNVSSSLIDGYATVGRRTTRPYEHRTMSLLEPPSSSTTSNVNYRRETRTPVRDYTSSILRSNSHYRSPAPSRSPTNI